MRCCSLGFRDGTLWFPCWAKTAISARRGGFDWQNKWCETSLPAAKLTEPWMHLRLLLRAPIKNDGPHEIGTGTRKLPCCTQAAGPTNKYGPCRDTPEAPGHILKTCPVCMSQCKNVSRRSRMPRVAAARVSVAVFGKACWRQTCSICSGTGFARKVTVHDPWRLMWRQRFRNL